MGAFMKSKNQIPDLIISSPATRAFETAKHVSKAIDYPVNDIRIAEEMYTFDESTTALFYVLKQLDDEVGKVLVFGHNSTFTFLANHLSKEVFINIPTAGLTAFQLNIDSWSKIDNAGSDLLFYQFPKEL